MLPGLIQPLLGPHLLRRASAISGKPMDTLIFLLGRRPTPDRFGQVVSAKRVRWEVFARIYRLARVRIGYVNAKTEDEAAAKANEKWPGQTLVVLIKPEQG